MSSQKEPLRLTGWIKQRVCQMVYEVGQVAAEETTELVEEVGHAVLDSTQAVARRALIAGSDRLRDYLRIRKRGE